MSGKIIKNVELKEIRKSDGAQFYKWGPGYLDSIWLCGWNRAANVKVGDKGFLEFRTGQHGRTKYGLYWFVKEV